jgi:hypothetical protein
MKEHKEKYKQNLKEVRDQAIDDLEPVVKKSGDSLIKLLQEMFNDFISELFKKRRKGK